MALPFILRPAHVHTRGHVYESGCLGDKYIACDPFRRAEREKIKTAGEGAPRVCIKAALAGCTLPLLMAQKAIIVGAAT
jgi:hypothetical protein